jgi:hypothetical protein
MSTADRFARVATALVGALVLSTLSIGATVGPASAADGGQSWIAQPPVTAPAHA